MSVCQCVCVVCVCVCVCVCGLCVCECVRVWYVCVFVCYDALNLNLNHCERLSKLQPHNVPPGYFVQDLRDLHQRMVDERKEEQRMAEAEKQRLDDILLMCAEYERQLERERLGGAPAPAPTSSLAQNANKRDSSDSQKSSESRNSMTKIKTNGSLTMLATSPTLTHKEGMTSSQGGATSTSSWGRRSSNSSASEEDLSGDNGTIKRRPANHSAGLDPVSSPANTSASRSENASLNLSAFDASANSFSSSVTGYGATGLERTPPASGVTDFFGASLNRHQPPNLQQQSVSATDYTSPSFNRQPPSLSHQSVSHDSALKSRHVTQKPANQEASDLGMRLNLLGVSPLAEKPEPWSPTEVGAPGYDPSLRGMGDPTTPTSSGIGTASNDSLDHSKVRPLLWYDQAGKSDQNCKQCLDTSFHSRPHKIPPGSGARTHTPTHTHARTHTPPTNTTHTHTDTHTHARTHTPPTHPHTHTHTHTHTLVQTPKDFEVGIQEPRSQCTTIISQNSQQSLALML